MVATDDALRPTEAGEIPVGMGRAQSPATTGAPAQRPLSLGVLAGGVVVAIVAAACVRWPAINLPLWLDEIMSLMLSVTLKSQWGVLTELHHDNNHHLNTWWMNWQGMAAPDWRFRTLAYVSGLVAIPVAALVGSRWGRGVALGCAVLTAGQSLWTIYGTEARGYATAGAAMLLMWWALQQELRRPRWWSATLVQLAACIGLLSHLSFAYVLIGFVLARAITLLLGWNQRQTVLPSPMETAPSAAEKVTLAGLLEQLCWDYLRWGLLPSIVGIVLLIDLNQFLFAAQGGVPAMEMWPMILVFPIDAGDWGPWRLLLGTCWLGLAAVGLRTWLSQRDWSFWFTLLAGFMVPALVAVVRAELLFPRYFLLAVLCWGPAAITGFLQLWTGSFWQSATSDMIPDSSTPSWGRGVVCLGLLMLAAGWGWFSAQTMRLASSPERNNAVFELQRMNERRSTKEGLMIGTDQELLAQMEMHYSLRHLPPETKFVIVPAKRFPQRGVEWYILHGIVLSDRKPPPDVLPDVYGNQYRRITPFQTEGRFIGWRWFVYHNENYATQAAKSAPRATAL